MKYALMNTFTEQLAVRQLEEIRLVEMSEMEATEKNRGFHDRLDLLEYRPFNASVTDRGDGYFSIGPVLYNHLGRVAMEDVCRSRGWVVTEPQLVERAREVNAFLDAYRELRKNHVPSAEERFEMDAAFGKGATVVNTATGQRFKV